MLVSLCFTPGAAHADDPEERLGADILRIESLLARARDRQALSAVEMLESRAPRRPEVIALHLRIYRLAPRTPRQLAALVRACEAPVAREYALDCARVLVLAGDFDGAMQLATLGAAQYDPATSAVLAEVALGAERHGDREKAALAAERAYAYAPDNPDRALLAARHRIERGQPASASTLLEPLLVAAPDHQEARALAASAAMLAGDHERAIAHQRQRAARCTATERPRCLADLATAQLYGHRLDDAIESATLASALACPEDPRSHLVLGMALVRRGREDEARAALAESFRRRPDPATRGLLRALENR